MTTSTLPKKSNHPVTDNIGKDENLEIHNICICMTLLVKKFFQI